MFRKEDFKKVDLLGSGKKNTKIFKAKHIPSGKYFALKEIEAKSIEKLNEYKEEAVQLCKIKNHPNIIQTYNYYFYETQVNTFRLAIVCELMDESMNLERVFRKRQQKGLFWKESDLEKLIVSLISTLSFLQSIGICHRDIKPSNLFIMPNGEMKIIDFGESKDYFADTDDGGEGTLATIRGTPQYLSPILWKAYVIDKETRHSTHNIYKSDVFSSGLVFFQIASLEDVTGFNNINDGEQLIEKNLKKLRKRYSEHI
jgi:serine/threonine protein kinase